MTAAKKAKERVEKVGKQVDIIASAIDDYLNFFDFSDSDKQDIRNQILLNMAKTILNAQISNTES